MNNEQQGLCATGLDETVAPLTNYDAQRFLVSI
jgi:hypothetical protein